MSYQLSHQKLRQDLAWALRSPNLMSLENNITLAPDNNELNRWLDMDNRIEQLREYIAQRNPRRLGIYFEVLWHYFLDQHPAFNLIARNLPVRDKGNTLGEFDFIYFCHQRQRYIHLETAVKFYLGIPANGALPSRWEQWIGPGSQDRLDLKLNKMLDRQTQLSRTTPGAALLAELGVKQVISEICLKGYFFYPLTTRCSAPKVSNKSHLRGYWIKLSEYSSLDKHSLWIILEKEQWLSPAINVNPDILLDYASLKDHLHQHFTDNKFPVLLALIKQGIHGYAECTRYFVTRNDWPYYL